MVDEFEKSDPEGNIDRFLARLAAEAPAVKQAEAMLQAAKRELAQVELELRYCDVVAEIDGVITRRSVNPGNNVQPGEGLMAIRSLKDIWVDANLKKTQLGASAGGAADEALGGGEGGSRDRGVIPCR